MSDMITLILPPSGVQFFDSKSGLMQRSDQEKAPLLVEKRLSSRDSEN
jgi:hypothetical protein